MNDKTAVFYFSSIEYNFPLYQRPQQLVREWRSNFRGTRMSSITWSCLRLSVSWHAVHHLKQSLETLLLKKRNRNAEDAFVLTWLGNPRFFRGSAVRRTLNQLCEKTQTKVAIVASPFWEPFVSKDDFDLLCYDYLDPIDRSLFTFIRCNSSTRISSGRAISYL